MLAATGPLIGIRVVELGSLGPGPYTCMLLAELGADVIRLDRPGGGVSSTVSAEMEALHRSRPNIAVDLKSAGGRDLVLRLVSSADVLVEGMRPGVTERLGIGPEECARRNPRLVYTRITGWGQDGPLASSAGHDINYLGLTGVLHAIGPAADPVPPLNVGADFGGGAMFALVGILAALLERGTSGCGQVVDAAMVDGASSLATMVYGMLAAGRWHDRRHANLLDGGAPFYTTYRCADGRHIAVGAIEPQFYTSMLRGFGLLGTLRGGQHDQDCWLEHRRLIAERVAERTRDEWTAAFADLDACVTPVLALNEAARHPHMAARQTFFDANGTPQPGPAPRFSRTPGGVRGTPRRVGEDTLTALAAWGLSTADVDELVATGAVRQAQLGGASRSVEDLGGVGKAQ